MRKGKKTKRTNRPTSCKHSEKQAECKTTNRTLCGLRSGAVLREPLPLQKDRQKWRKKVWLLFFLHVRGAENVTTTWYTQPSATPYKKPQQSLTREVSSLILTETEQSHVLHAQKETFLEQHQPDLDPFALENQKQRTTEREAPTSSTISSIISICGGEKMHCFNRKKNITCSEKQISKVIVHFFHFQAPADGGSFQDSREPSQRWWK